MSNAPMSRAVAELKRQALSRAAHWHADQGYAVFPLAPGRKVPAVEDWEAAATTDHLAIVQTWRKAPYNIGVGTGPSGLVVVDLDQPKNTADEPPEPWRTRGASNGAEVLALVARDQTSHREGEHTTAPTYAVTTPSGGRHLYYRQPAGRPLGNSAGRIGWKIDTRGHGGYVVGASSITAAGRYTVTAADARLSPQPLPTWIINALNTPHPPGHTTRPVADLKDTDAYTAAALSGEIDNVLAAVPGQRNDTLNRAAFALGQLVGAHLLETATARDELISAATRIGLSRTEAERTITSGLTAGTRHPRRRSA
ncbi:bifunctional DNA primase/polymerase [Kribbella sp. NPDC026596]|uniref:bifunctional DNA primase/polymerase n=1 Tax=Kribbella sp. NPDC026596 TaxID=3155122 RepID=UPI0033EBA99A